MSVRYPNSSQTPSTNVNTNRNNLSSELSTYAVVRTTSTAKIISAVVFTIIVVTLLIAAVAVPLALALTNTGPFSTTTSSSTTTTTVATTTIATTTAATTTVATTTVATTTVATTAVSTTSSFSECSSYTTISDATRLTTAASGSTCDTSTFFSNVTWVRFTGAGGTQLATTAPSANQCGSASTGWYSTSLPSSGTTVNGTVCYVWSGNNCNWSNTIRVTNCGSFYVFGLIAPPACNLRYCTV
ncbi:hypothetical protein I4U23_010735 [Adineta vaga]|nr:hypothetical protein I4U23_010735 [Adineta vaga]